MLKYTFLGKGRTDCWKLKLQYFGWVQGSLLIVFVSIIQAMPPMSPLTDFLEPLMMDQEQADQYKKVEV